MAFETTNRKGLVINGQWVFSGDFITLGLAAVDKRTLQKYRQDGIVVQPVFARGNRGKTVRGFFFSEKKGDRKVLEVAEGMITEMVFDEETPPEVESRNFRKIFRIKVQAQTRTTAICL